MTDISRSAPLSFSIIGPNGPSPAQGIETPTTKEPLQIQ